jgi:DNA-binding PadR family transcriptional regulator
MPETLPDITHLQFLILGSLRADEMAGRGLRALLRQRGARRSGPAFYQMMGRLEDAGLVEGRYDQRQVDGHAVKERRYRITAAGEAAWRSTRDFYLEAIPDPDLGKVTDRA